MSAPDLVGGMTRLHRTSTAVVPSAGVTVARTNSGPIAKSGCDRVARNTWASTAPGVAASRSQVRTRALDRDRRELSREVLLERQLLLDDARSEEHTSELQSLTNLVCRLLLEKKKKTAKTNTLPTKQCHRQKVQ